MAMLSSKFNKPPFRPDPLGRCAGCDKLKKVKVFGKVRLCAKCAEDVHLNPNPLPRKTP